MENHMLTTNQVAKHLSLTVSMVRQLIREKQLPALKLGHRSYRVKPEDLELFKKNRQTVAS